jgi:hypothetical protein
MQDFKESLLAPPAGSRLGLAFAGLIGSVLTLYPPVRFDLNLSEPVKSRLSDVLSGFWFGAALAVYFLVSGSRSLWRPVALSIISLFTWHLAVYMAAAVGAATQASDLAGIFAGGASGALVMSTVTFVFYGTEPEGIRSKIFICTLAGGVLGVVGFFPRGRLIWPMFVIWQTGLAFLIGLLWPGEPSPSLTPPP